jgi:hypothetical protein
MHIVPRPRTMARSVIPINLTSDAPGVNIDFGLAGFYGSQLHRMQIAASCPRVECLIERLTWELSWMMQGTLMTNPRTLSNDLLLYE